MTLREWYRLLHDEGEEGNRARTLLEQTHWFTVNAEFDPKTGEALPQALSTFLAKVASPKPADKKQDRLDRIVEHVRPALDRLLGILNESPHRERAMLPLRAVRELDAGSFIKLSTRPGRTIREKLAGKPYLHAVRRVQSVDLPENRLLKVFVTRLAELLELRRDLLGEEEDELLIRIRSWLLSDVAKTIGEWKNVPYNNTLLSHRDYRRVWDAWRRLQTLDDDITCDLSQLEARQRTMQQWIEYGQMYAAGTHRFAEIPVLFNYDQFEIRPWSSPLVFQKAPKRINRSSSKQEISQPVCLDLSEPRPSFAVSPQGANFLRENYLWQQWKNDKETVDLSLFDSDALYLHPEAVCIASPDLFFRSDKNPDHLESAAWAFAVKLRETFRNDTLLWLVPDFLNDFQLEIIRRNLNAHFPKAQPLPRSVAAVFERIAYSQIRNDSYCVVVVDTIGGVTCATKLIAKRDPNLKKRLPQTNGFYWERCPPIILPCPDTEKPAAKEQGYCMLTVNPDGQWCEGSPPEQPQLVDQKTLEEAYPSDRFDFCVRLTQSPVAGGIYFHELQQRAGDIRLWCDQIPELSIKVWKDGWYKRLDLVPRGTTVTPIRGQPIPIPVRDTFTLPAGKPYYQFPLFQGINSSESVSSNQVLAAARRRDMRLIILM